MKNKKINTSVVVSIKDRDRIKIFIEEFKKKTSFKISIAQFIKQAINEKLENEK